MKSNSEYFDINRANWDESTDIHLAGSDWYPIEDFKKGKCALRALELDEVGDVTGKSMLHLQCHFGMDTLSWARRGAHVTGVDFSEKAIAAAKALSRETGVDARFVCCNVYDLLEHLDGKFDIVYTSYGVLYWLPDLRSWAQIVSSFLKEGGLFYIADGHPFVNGCINEDGDAPRLEGDYFALGQAKWEEPDFDYANTEVKQSIPEYGWRHTVGEVINSLIEAGLRLCHFNEFPSFDVVQSKDGQWRAAGPSSPYPKMFSLKAIKDR
ncbi:class I SAM-dependent methyltransferase [Candidatus Hydrogenedentota bacterium]